jgi:glutathione S-transferase
MHAYTSVRLLRLSSGLGSGPESWNALPYHPAMLTLYFARGTCALATHLALEYAGADYRTVRIDFATRQQQSREYLRLNPKGRVPALVTDRGVLTETPALLLFIAQSFPDANLAPLTDAFELARANDFNSYLCSTVHVAHSHRMRGYRWADDEAAIEAMKKKVPQNICDCFELIERDMLEGPWVLGGRFSICDVYLFTVAGWTKSDGVDMHRFPKVADHYARMSADPVVEKVLAAQNAA